MNTPLRLELLAVDHFPDIVEGSKLVPVIVRSLAVMGEALADGDVLVVASKIISKSEGRKVRLRDVRPSFAATQLALEVDKDERLVELVLRESDEVVRKAPGVLVVRHRLGFISANAGIDASNVGRGADLDEVLLLPEDPDASARSMADEFRGDGLAVSVVIADTHGRPFRRGNCGVAIGLAGMDALSSYDGQSDLYGRTLLATLVPTADLLASAAGLVSGEGSEGRPVVLVRGLREPARGAGTTGAAALVRDPDMDLFASEVRSMP